MSKKPSNPTPTGGSKNQRKQRIREIAKQERERQERHQRRVRWAWQGGIAAVVLAAIVVIVLVIVTSSKPQQTAAGPENMLSDGIVFASDGSGQASVVSTPGLEEGGEPVPTDASDNSDSVPVVVYLDYMCPYCGQFETTNSDQLTALAAQGTITLEIHPISFLDNLSRGTNYSTRAANAAACVANYAPNSFLAVNSAFFTNQPEENSTGLTNDELWTLIQSAGVTDEKVRTCIDDGTFTDWVAQATERAMEEDLPYLSGDEKAPLKGTPTVIIDGKLYSGPIDDATALTTAIQQAYEGGGATTPSATPSTSAPATEK